MTWKCASLTSIIIIIIFITGLGPERDLHCFPKLSDPTLVEESLGTPEVKGLGTPEVRNANVNWLDGKVP